MINLMVIFCVVTILPNDTVCTSKFVETILSLQHHYNVRSVMIFWESLSKMNSRSEGNLIMYMQKTLSMRGVMTINSNINELLTNSIYLDYLWKRKTMCCILPMKDANTSNVIFKKIAELNLMKKNIWLALVNDELDIKELFQDVHIKFDSEFFIVQEKHNTVELTEVYRVAKQQPLVVYSRRLSSSDLLDKWSSTYLYNRRRSFHNILLQAGAVNGYPIVSLDKNKDGIVLKGGTIKPVVKILQDYLNFRINLSSPKDNKWGTFENGSWSGLMGMLERNEVDLVINMISMTDHTLNIMDFITTVSLARMYVYMKRPVLSGMTWRSYVQPFSPHLWVAIIFIIFIISLIFTLFELQSTKTYIKCTMFIYMTMFLNAVGIFCSQDMCRKNISNIYRLAVLSSFVTSMILLCSYSAFIVSYLTVQRVELPFTDYKGILADGSYKLGVLAHSTFLNIFKNTSDPERSTVYKKLIAPIENELPPFTLTALHQVCREQKFLFLTFDVIADPCSQIISCQLVKLPDIKYMVHFTMPTIKNSSYTGILSHVILKLIEGGILKKVANDFKQNYNGETDFVVQSITMQNTATIFLLLSIGAFTSLFVLILEILYNKIYYKHTTVCNYDKYWLNVK